MPSYYRAPSFQAASLNKWLDTTRRYDSHFGSFLFNHLAHNFVVLAASSSGLKRTPNMLEAKQQWWHDLYVPQLQNSLARPVDESMPIITRDNWRTHVDKTLTLYPTYLDYFDKQVVHSDQSVSNIIQEYVPFLGRGLVGSALHGIIHLGLAVEAGHKGMLAEGLANMCTIYTPLADPGPSPPPLWVPSSSSGIIATSLAYLQEAIAEGRSAEVLAVSCSPEYEQLPIGAFQRKVRVFCDPDEGGAVMAGLNRHFPVQLPASPVAAEGGEVDTEAETEAEAETETETETASLEGAVREAQALMAAAYLASDGEFFVIHGATSLHAVLCLLPHLRPEQQRDLLSHWLRAVLAVYVAINTPGVGRLVDLLGSWQEQEQRQQLQQQEPRSIDKQDDQQLRDDQLRWASRLSLSQLSEDEHVSKGVYVMWRWTQWLSSPPGRHAHTLDLFARAADWQLRPLDDSGEVTAPHQHLWFSR